MTRDDDLPNDALTKINDELAKITIGEVLCRDYVDYVRALQFLSGEDGADEERQQRCRRGDDQALPQRPGAFHNRAQAEMGKGHGYLLEGGIEIDGQRNKEDQ